MIMTGNGNTSNTILKSKFKIRNVGFSPEFSIHAFASMALHTENPKEKTLERGVPGFLRLRFSGLP